MREIRVKLKPDSEFMTLNILLKIEGVIQTGGMAKIYLLEHTVLVNGEEENRRGRKLYPGDVVEVEKTKYLIVR